VRVTVIGGGIAGLSAASELLAAGAETTVLETADRLGGQVRTTREEGFVVEEGADTFGATGQLGADWARALGMAQEIFTPPDHQTLVLLNGSLDRLTAGGSAALLGIPHPDASHDTAPNTLACGMEALVQAAADALGDRVDLRSGNGAVALAHDSGWQVFPELGSAIHADALVFAIPPKASAWLVHPVHPEAARHLTQLSARSVVVVSLAFRRDDVAHPLDASGLTVPLGRSDTGLQSCTFTSSRFPARAPDGTVLLRAVIRPARGELASITDAEWEAKATAFLEPILGIRAEPVMAWVTRWPEAVPDSLRGSHDHITAARNALSSLSPVEFAGATFHEPGIDGAIVSGRQAALRLLSAAPAG